jgi:glycosyltransferase involved in cell wall biosynthesis
VINVTFLTGEYPPMQGGIADHTAYLAHHLTAVGAASSILTSRRWLEADTESPALFAHSGARQPLIFPLLPGWGRHAWPAIRRYLETYQPDILHLQYQAAAFDLAGWINWLPWYLKRRKGRTRVVTTFHDLRVPYIFPKAGPFRWQSMLALARHSDAVICTNREDLYTLAKQLSVTSVQLPGDNLQSLVPNPQSPLLSLIPLGSNVEPQPPADFDRQAWRGKYQADPETLLLAYFGFMNESKGGEELIEALALLRQRGLDARLLLIGGDVGHADPTNVAYAQKVQALIEQHQLGAFVHRTGYVDLAAVSANLLAADAVVMPYRDGVSFRRTTLIAALRHGCPVVSTFPADPALIPEIRSGENMLLVPPRQAEALAQTLSSLATDTALRQRLASGAKTLGDLFEWESIAGQTVALYRAINP